MLTKLKALAVKAAAAVKAARQTATTVAGFAAQLVALGVLHGTALTVAQGVLAVATILGVHVAAKSAAKAAARAQVGAAIATLAQHTASATVATQELNDTIRNLS